MKSISLAAIAAAAALAAPAAWANHSWGNYHWSISGRPLALDIADNVSGAWDPLLDVAIDDWTFSWDYGTGNGDEAVLAPNKIAGSGSTRTCKADTGTVMVCNDSYGNNGWLGIAQIWTSGDHITKGVTKLNDFYFNFAPYNGPGWRQLVICQEIGHTFGLAHQDENFDNPNFGTCMDYTSNPLGPPDNLHPNYHDYEELASIYTHTHAADSGGGGGGGKGPPWGRGGAGNDIAPGDAGNDPSGWGRPVGYTADGRPDVYERKLDNGQRVITHVFWVPDRNIGYPH